MGKSQTYRNIPRRPLLVIDGDSFAHRSYHALPKTILRRGRKQAGAIVGFANMLLRLYREEEPRAVLVAWDTLEVPTYRHEEFSDYQSGREFDDALVEQLDLLPEFVGVSVFVEVAKQRQAVALKRDDVYTLRRLGVVTAKLNDLQGSYNYFEAALTIEPNDAQTIKDLELVRGLLRK